MSTDAWVIMGGVVAAGAVGAIWSARQYDQRVASYQKQIDAARDVNERSQAMLDRQQEVIGRSLALLDRQEELLKRAESLLDRLENNKRFG
jgi:hypothetical protein